MNQYPSYKPSGVDWIGEIPVHWCVQKLKHFSKVETGSTPPKSEDANYSEDGIPWIKPDDLRGFVPVLTSKDKISESGAEYVRIVPLGSVLVCGIGTIGKFGIAGRDLCTNQQINAVTFDRKIVMPEFGKYLLATSTHEMVRYSNRVVVSILTKSNQSDIKYAVPPIAEQSAISGYLDEKTSLIDETVRKKQQLIELLHEERTAVINQAVTRGLNRDVKMKPSGVDWIGDVPEHWNIGVLKRGLNLLTDYEANGSFASAKENVNVVEGKYGYAWFVRATDLENGNIADKNSGRWVDENTYEFLNKTSLEAGDLLVVKRGEIGKVYLLPKIEVPATLAPNMYLLRLNSLLRPKFTYYWLKSKCGSFQLEQRNASTTLGALYKDDCKDILIPFIPVREQEQIEERLDETITSISKTVSKIEHEIKLLQEYRTALINEVVTGKRCVVVVDEEVLV